MVVWECDSGLTEEGDEEPTCSYCGKKASSGEIHDTNISGNDCCENEKCILQLGQDNLESLWEENGEENDK